MSERHIKLLLNCKNDRMSRSASDEKHQQHLDNIFNQFSIRVYKGDRANQRVKTMVTKPRKNEIHSSMAYATKYRIPKGTKKNHISTKLVNENRERNLLLGLSGQLPTDKVGLLLLLDDANKSMAQNQLSIQAKLLKYQHQQLLENNNSMPQISSITASEYKKHNVIKNILSHGRNKIISLQAAKRYERLEKLTKDFEVPNSPKQKPLVIISAKSRRFSRSKRSTLWKKVVLNQHHNNIKQRRMRKSKSF